MNVRCIGLNSVYDENCSIKRSLTEKSFMLILMKSSGIFMLNGVECHAEKDTVVIYDKGAVQEYGSDGGIFLCDWIIFDADDEADFLETLEIPLNTLIHCTDADFLSGIIRNIAVEFYSVSSRMTKMTESLMKTLMIKISECSPMRRGVQLNVEPYYSGLAELREKIYRNPQLKWNVDTMAADVNMSRSYFQHIYREVFGVSCIADVISGKIEKAKEMLSETSCTVSQVAAMCGYENEEHFMRQFKKLVGVTPTAYRRKN